MAAQLQAHLMPISLPARPAAVLQAVEEAGNSGGRRQSATSPGRVQEMSLLMNSWHSRWAGQPKPSPAKQQEHSSAKAAAVQGTSSQVQGTMITAHKTGKQLPGTSQLGVRAVDTAVAGASSPSSSLTSASSADEPGHAKRPAAGYVSSRPPSSSSLQQLVGSAPGLAHKVQPPKHPPAPFMDNLSESSRGRRDAAQFPGQSWRRAQNVTDAQVMAQLQPHRSASNASLHASHHSQLQPGQPSQHFSNHDSQPGSYQNHIRPPTNQPNHLTQQSSLHDRYHRHHSSSTPEIELGSPTSAAATAAAEATAIRVPSRTGDHSLHRANSYQRLVSTGPRTARQSRADGYHSCPAHSSGSSSEGSHGPSSRHVMLPPQNVLPPTLANPYPITWKGYLAGAVIGAAIGGGTLFGACFYAAAIAAAGGKWALAGWAAAVANAKWIMGSSMLGAAGGMDVCKTKASSMQAAAIRRQNQQLGELYERAWGAREGTVRGAAVRGAAAATSMQEGTVDAASQLALRRPGSAGPGAGPGMVGPAVGSRAFTGAATSSATQQYASQNGLRHRNGGGAGATGAGRPPASPSPPTSLPFAVFSHQIRRQPARLPSSTQLPHGFFHPAVVSPPASGASSPIRPPAPLPGSPSCASAGSTTTATATDLPQQQVANILGQLQLHQAESADLRLRNHDLEAVSRSLRAALADVRGEAGQLQLRVGSVVQQLSQQRATTQGLEARVQQLEQGLDAKLLESLQRLAGGVAGGWSAVQPLQQTAAEPMGGGSWPLEAAAAAASEVACSSCASSVSMNSLPCSSRGAVGTTPMNVMAWWGSNVQGGAMAAASAATTPQSHSSSSCGLMGMGVVGLGVARAISEGASSPTRSGFLSESCCPGSGCTGSRPGSGSGSEEEAGNASQQPPCDCRPWPVHPALMRSNGFATTATAVGGRDAMPPSLSSPAIKPTAVDNASSSSSGSPAKPVAREMQLPQPQPDQQRLQLAVARRPSDGSSITSGDPGQLLLDQGSVCSNSSSSSSHSSSDDEDDDDDKAPGSSRHQQALLLLDHEGDEAIAMANAFAFGQPQQHQHEDGGQGHRAVDSCWEDFAAISL